MANPTWDETKDLAPTWESTVDVAKPAESPGGAAQAALEGFGQGATLGYLPQIQAVTQPLIDRGLNLVTGANVEPAPWSQMVPGSPEYVKARDENLKRQETQIQAHPNAALGGQIAGTIATAVVPGKIAASGIGTAGKIGSIAKGAAVGAGEAALLNPGDTAGEFNPLQIKERVDNAKFGAAFGGGAGLAAKGISSAVSGSKNLAEKIGFKSSGAMLKDFRKAADMGKVNDLGRFMLDKVLKAGDSFDDVAEKAEALKRGAGQEIGKIYSGVLEKLGDENFWSKLEPAKKSALSFSGFRPQAQSAEIIKSIDDSLGNLPNKKAAVNFVSDYLQDLSAKYGNDLDIVTANTIKGDIDKSINYGKRIQDLPEKQEALYALRNHIRDRIDDHIKVLDEIVGGNQIKELKAANKLYGAASEIEDIAFDRVQRESANRFFSLGDRITGAATTAGGAASGALLGGDTESALKGAALGLGAAGLSKVARSYGPALAAKSLDTLSKATGATAIPNALASTGVRAANSPEFKKNGLPPEVPTQRLAPSEEKPKKGPEKWANDGADKLLKSGSISQEQIDKLRQSKIGKDLLIQASDLKPGTKAMDNVLRKIKEASLQGSE